MISLKQEEEIGPKGPITLHHSSCLPTGYYTNIGMLWEFEFVDQNIHPRIPKSASHTLHVALFSLLANPSAE